MLSLLLMLTVPQAGDAAADAVCVAGPAAVLVGEQYRRGVSTRAKRLSGARSVRVVMPGEVTTQEFQDDRLTLRVDHRRTIMAVRCG